MRPQAPYVLVVAMLIHPLASSVGLGQSSSSDAPRVRALTLVPAPIDPEARHSLLMDPNALTAGDGAVLYCQAAQALPSNLNEQQIRNWGRMSPGKLPQAQVERTLQQVQKSLEQLELATRCRQCSWPPFVQGTMPRHLEECRRLAQLLCLQARLQIARGQYDDAIDTMRTGMAMARQVGEGPTVMQGMVGVAIATIVLRQGEDMAQSEGSPNLYAALAELPRPLVDLEKPIAAELNNLESNPQYNFLVRAAMRRQLKDTYVRVRQLMHRLDRDVAALQCIEALRHYAATHENQLPGQMADITDIAVPQNPNTNQPFGYRRNGPKAVLDAAAAPGGQPHDAAVRYDITLAP